MSQALRGSTSPASVATPVHDPGRTHIQLPRLLRLSPRQLREDVRGVEGANAKVALITTRVVGTMWMFYVFNGIALVSLPSAIKSGNLTILIAWVSSNWLQLILLPAIMVGQSLGEAKSDARAQKTFEDTETILDRLDTRTTGGLREVLEAVEALKR